MIKFILNILFLFPGYILFSQDDCPEYTHTDPNPSYVQPISSGFKTNTFDWTGTNNTDHTISINKPSPVVSSTILSPYYQTADLYMAAIALSANSDNRPEDGWELIKQDMGYYYNVSSVPPWEGYAFGTATGIENKTAAYIVLYNKYQSTLRIFAVLPTQGSTTADVTAVNLTFFNASNSLNAPVSALFNNYNTIEQTLDQSTITAQVSAMAIQPNTSDRFIYADFPMSYDPCTCFFESDLLVSFSAITTSTLTAAGRSLGTAVPIADVTSGLIGSSGVKGEDPFSDNYITSFVPNGNSATPSSLVQDFQNAQSLASQWTSSGGSSIDWADIFSKIFKLGSDLAQTVGAAYTISTQDGTSGAGIANTIGFALASGGDIADFFTGSNQNNNNFPLVISSQLVLGGSITTNTAQNGSEFILAVPGNPNAAGEPEYGQMVSASTPSYPMYNQTMGLFALLTPPNVNVFFDDQSTTFSDAVDGINVKHEYQFANNFQYAFNPIIDEAATKIWASLQIESFPATGTFSGSSTGFSGSSTVDFSTDVETNLNFVSNAVDGNKILRTPFLPIECQTGVIATDALPEIVLNSGTDQTNYKAIVDAAGLNVKLQLMIVYVFKPDEYGAVHTSSQILTYPVTLVNQTSELTAPAGFQSFSPFPTNLTIPATTFTSSNEVFSFGTITITGNITNTSGNTLYITAEQGVIVSPGVIVGPNIILRVEPGPMAFCNQTPIAQTSVGSSFCNSSSYKANQLSLHSQAGNTTDSVSQNNFVISLFPNPTSNKCNIVFALPGADNCLITLCDMMGRTIKTIDNSWYPQGSSTISVNTAGLASGMYMVHFSDASNTVTKQLVISRD